MQTKFRPIRRAEAAYALGITLLFIGFSLILFGSMLYWTTTNAKITARNNAFYTSAYAAEAAAENALAWMDRDFTQGTLNPASSYTTYLPWQTNWPVQYLISDTNGVANQVSVTIFPQSWITNWQGLSSAYAGNFGAVANCAVIAVATPSNQPVTVPATVCLQFQLCLIPCFQFGVFYNLDLEIENGQALTMNGPVFCNANIWYYPSASLTFNSTVQSVLNCLHQQPPNDEQSQSGSGTVTFVLPNQPSIHVPSLALPIGTNAPGTATSPSAVEAILNWPPPAYALGSSAAYTTNGLIYLANECDLIISNSMSGTNGAWGTNVTVYYQDPSAPLGPLIGLTNEMFTFSNFYTHSTNLWTTNSPNPPNKTNYTLVAAGFPFVTNVVFYDYRQQSTVQAVQVDVAKFGQWLTNTAFEGNWRNGQCYNNKGHMIDSVYIYNNVSGSTTLPAVRMVNGQQMPSRWGLTVATPQPLYVKGNYNVTTNNGANTSLNTTNTAYTWPASLMGDAITILSGNWSDAYNASTSLSSRTVTSNITVNAACLEGIVVSTNISGKKWYSGGLENFLRLEEDWNSDSPQLWYNGSIVVMFPSIYATNFWVPPSQLSGYPTPYYGVPTRKWGFDYNYLYAGKMPPCAPCVKAVLRSGWSAY
jgi:hypothetical protein